MKYIHRISFRATHEQIAELHKLGMKLEPEGEVFDEPEPMILFRLAEDHPHWPLIQALMLEWGKKGDRVYTEFTQRELDSARWLEMSAWQNGYPQPADDEKFRDVTYDLTACCNDCKLGKIQNAPFRIKGEPKWGRRGIMTLLWIHEEFFVPPAAWETIFKPFGITCRPVANRHGKLLDTVVQLVIEEEVDMVTDGLDSTACATCGRRKYHGTGRGRFPPLIQEPKGALARTRQSFGSGWECIRATIISQELHRAIISHKLRGAEFVPVESHLDAFEA